MTVASAGALPPAIAYHRLPIRLLNRILRVLNAAGIANVRMDEQFLIDQACQQTGLTDFGDTGFLEPFRVLLNSFEKQADLNPVGRFLTNQSLIRLLKNRLYAHELLKRHPEILARKMPPPTVIVGLGRSGTTRLHRLLACDQQFLHLQAWESVYPVPFPESFNASVDPRITSIERGLKAVLYMSPQVAAVHPLGAYEVEEELGLLQHGFATQIFEICAWVPGFAEWIMTHPQDPAYEYMLTLMKIISWFRKDPEDKPWILKTPQHMQDLDALLRLFPDAKIICPHRDPVKVMGSLCSMVWNAIVRDSDSVQAQWIGDAWLTKTERMLEKTLAIRDQYIAPQNQMDILYADISADWQASMEKIYNFTGMELNKPALQGMQSWLHRNNQHKHGMHRYRLEDFGLSVAEVDERLDFYRQRFSIPYELHNPHTHR